MARSALQDYLQVFPFWLMDVAPSEALSLPIFSPLSGFASITAPEISIELNDIKEGNWHFKRSSIKSADVSPITLTRGVTFSDSDFWRWAVASIVGDTDWQLKIPFVPPVRIGGPTPRRQLVLVQFFARNPIGSIGGIGADLAAASAAVTNLGDGLVGVPDFAVRVPARAWVLHGCLPTRYKAGGDFDARSGEVSIAELDLKPELVEEISLTS